MRTPVQIGGPSPDLRKSGQPAPGRLVAGNRTCIIRKRIAVSEAGFSPWMNGQISDTSNSEPAPLSHGGAAVVAVWLSAAMAYASSSCCLDRARRRPSGRNGVIKISNQPKSGWSSSLISRGREAPTISAISRCVGGTLVVPLVPGGRRNSRLVPEKY